MSTSKKLTTKEKHPELFMPQTNIVRRGCKRVVPMEVMNLGFPRTGTMCKSGVSLWLYLAVVLCLVSIYLQRMQTEIVLWGRSNSGSPEHTRLQLLPFVHLLLQRPRLRHVERGHGRQISGPWPALHAPQLGSTAGQLQRGERRSAGSSVCRGAGRGVSRGEGDLGGA